MNLNFNAYDSDQQNNAVPAKNPKKSRSAPKGKKGSGPKRVPKKVSHNVEPSMTWQDLSQGARLAASLKDLVGVQNIPAVQAIMSILKKKGTKMSGVVQLYNIYDKVDITDDDIEAAKAYRGLIENPISLKRNKTYSPVITTASFFQFLETIMSKLSDVTLQGDILSFHVDGKAEKLSIPINVLFNGGFFTEPIGDQFQSVFNSSNMKFLTSCDVPAHRMLYSLAFHEWIGLYPHTFPKKDEPASRPEFAFNQNSFQSFTDSSPRFKSLPFLTLGIAFRSALDRMEENNRTSTFSDIFIHDRDDVGTQGQFFVMRRMIEEAARGKEYFKNIVKFVDEIAQTFFVLVKNASQYKEIPKNARQVLQKEIPQSWKDAFTKEATAIVALLLPVGDITNSANHVTYIYRLLEITYLANNFWVSARPVIFDDDPKKVLENFLVRGFPGQSHVVAASECFNQRNALQALMSKSDVMTPLSTMIGNKNPTLLQAQHVEALDGLLKSYKAKFDHSMKNGAPHFAVAFFSNVLGDIVQRSPEFSSFFYPAERFTLSTENREFKIPFFVVTNSKSRNNGPYNQIKTSNIGAVVNHAHEKVQELKVKFETSIKDRYSTYSVESFFMSPSISQQNTSKILNAVYEVFGPALTQTVSILKPSAVGHGDTSILQTNMNFKIFPNPVNSNNIFVPARGFIAIRSVPQTESQKRNSLMDVQNAFNKQQTLLSMVHVHHYNEVLKSVNGLFQNKKNLESYITEDLTKNMFSVQVFKTFRKVDVIPEVDFIQSMNQSYTDSLHDETFNQKLKISDEDSFMSEPLPPSEKEKIQPTVGQNSRRPASRHSPHHPTSTNIVEIDSESEEDVGQRKKRRLVESVDSSDEMDQEAPEPEWEEENNEEHEGEEDAEVEEDPID